MRAKSSKQRCPALCILWLELPCSCRVGGWSGHLTASENRYDFPGVDHEGRQTCRLCHNCFITKIPQQNVINIVANVKDFKMTCIIFRNYYFWIIMQNLTTCNILNTFALKNHGKFADNNFEKLCSWPLALTIPVLGLERVCPRNVGPWPRIFFSSPWPWPRRLCPRLNLW